MHSVLPATIEIEISPNDRRFVFFFFCRRTDKYFSRAVSSLFARVENLFHNARNDRCGGRLDATFKFKVIPIVRTKCIERLGGLHNARQLEKKGKKRNVPQVYLSFNE